MRKIVPMAKEGWPFVVTPMMVGGGAALLGWVLVGGLFLAAGFVLALFFRDPKRRTPASSSSWGVMCPADGRVVSVAEAEEGEYLNAKSRRISIFMSVLNVHLNYAPIAGRVEYLKYRKGKFHRANLAEASVSNESNSIGIQGQKHRLMMRQVAGALARRIVCRVRVNEVVEAGQKIGLIKFGSRVDVFLPLEWEVVVKEGDRVKGGISPIARF